MIRMLAAFALLAGSAAFAADPVADAKLDKTVAASLREVHDRGADLYNMSKDYTGAYRLYEGALIAVKPLLGHRSETQKWIDDGLAAANKESDPAQKAFKLHELIEKVRADLKAAPKSKEPEPMPMKSKEPEPIKPKVPDPMPPVKPKPPEPLPMKPREIAPPPKPREEKAKLASLTGKITVQGKALAAGTVTLVPVVDKDAKSATGVVKDGSFAVKDLAPGKYTVAVIGKPAGSVPAKFGSEETSGLTLTVKDGPNELDLELK